MQHSQLIALSISPNSDESRKQSLYLDCDWNRHWNLIICSTAHCKPSLKISCKYVWNFLGKVANRQTNKQRQKHILLGRGNNSTIQDSKSSHFLLFLLPSVSCKSLPMLQLMRLWRPDALILFSFPQFVSVLSHLVSVHLISSPCWHDRQNLPVLHKQNIWIV